MILDYVAYFPATNTFEVRWLEAVYNDGVLVEYVPVRTHSYSSEQASDFIQDVGGDCRKYLTMAGWTS